MPSRRSVGAIFMNENLANSNWQGMLDLMQVAICQVLFPASKQFVDCVVAAIMPEQHLLGNGQRQPFHGVFHGLDVGLEASAAQRCAGNRTDRSQPHFAQGVAMLFVQKAKKVFRRG